MTAHDKDPEDQLRCAEKLFPDATKSQGCEEYFPYVGERVDMWICQLELAQDIACISGDDAQSDEEDDAWHKSDAADDRGQGEDSN